MLPHSIDEARGTLYIVATPIGNLEDMSRRAQNVLQQVAYIAAEDTRHSRKLLQHFGIETRLFSVHDHNEKDKVLYIISLLDQGESVALVSDAGTPLISDPGYHVVNSVREAGHKVVPIPGPSALITALCAAGLPTDKFYFSGFLPAKTKARQDVMSKWKIQEGTIIFYESTHRILDCIMDVNAVFGSSAKLVLARELTKTFETFLSGSPDDILAQFAADANQLRGEFVVLLDLVSETDIEQHAAEHKRILALLLDELPVKQAAHLAAKITGEKKNALYQMALEMQNK